MKKIIVVLVFILLFPFVFSQQCLVDSDCKCPNDYCDGSTLYDYPDNGYCGTAGSAGCMCFNDKNIECKPTISQNDTYCLESRNLEFDLDITPGNSCPLINQESVSYYVDTWLDEVPYNNYCLGYEDLLDIAYSAGWAGRSYAFDGEEINFTFIATDNDGILNDCVQGYITLDNGFDPRVVQCTKKLINDSTAEFFCSYIVESADMRYGAYWVSVEVSDSCGDGCSDTTPGMFSVFLNPSVGLTMDVPQDNSFEFAYDQAGDHFAKVENGNLVTTPGAGDTVYTPHFVIQNSADPDSGLYIMLQLYGTDFTAVDLTPVPLCPDANELDIGNMMYEANHLNAHQDWTVMPDGTNYGYLDADYVFTNWNSSDVNFNGAANILGIGDDITMRLKLSIPNPCQGSFTEGGEVIFVGRVI